MWVHNVLAVSNAMGLLALYECNHWLDRLVVAAVMTASTLMHISETKGGLDPGAFWQPYSARLLNIDRAVAVAATLYGVWLEWPIGGGIRHEYMLRLARMAVGTTILGEMANHTQRRAIYVCLHVIWHTLVYELLMMVVSRHS